MEISNHVQYAPPLFIDWLPLGNIENSEEMKSLVERIYDCFLKALETTLIVLELVGMMLATLTILPLFSDTFNEEWRRIFHYFFNNLEKQEPSNLELDENNQFVTLPKELLQEIFSHLSLAQVSSVRQVRKRFFEATCNPHFIISDHSKNNIRFTTEKILIIVENKGHMLELLDLSGLVSCTSQITSSQFRMIVSKCPNIHTLNLRRLDWITRDHVKEIKPLTKLTSLDFWEFIDLKDEDLLDLPLSLQQLSLRDCTGLTEKAIENLRPLKQLHILNLTGCNLGGQGLTHLENFQELEKIYLTGSGVNDESLKSLIQLKKLKVVFLSYCPGVTDVGINLLLEELPCLESLSFKGCRVSEDLKLRITNETKIRF